MNKRRLNRSSRLLLVAALLLSALLLCSGPARAAEPRSGENVIIGAAEIVEDDLYVAANTLTVDGTVKGDLVAAARQVTINGRIEGDVLVAAQAIVVSGQVDDDLRIVGEALMITPGARIMGDVAVGAASIEQQTGSVVGGDLLAGAYQALLAGTIERSVQAGLNRAELRGSIGGDANLTLGGEPAGSGAVVYQPSGQLPTPNVHAGLTIADTGRIGGKLTYSASTDATISPVARVEGGISASRTPVAERTETPPIPGLAHLQRLAALLLVGLLLLWLAPAWTRQLGRTVMVRPLPSLGWGALASVVLLATVLGVLIATVVLAALFGFLTLGGIAALVVSAGLLLDLLVTLGFVAFAAYVAAIIVSLVVGRWLVTYVQPAWAERPFVPLLVGLVVYVALSAVPVLGAVVGLLVVLMALGALWDWGSGLLRRSRPAAPPVSTLQPA